MKVIPAIDIINGQCVRLSEGDFDTKKVYYTHPLEAALAFEAAGIEYLHLVDLDGAKQGGVVNWKVLEEICRNTELKVDFSGGIKTITQVEKAFELGAAQIAVGSLAVKNQALVAEWLQHFGSDRIIIGADIKEDKIAINGWLQTSEFSIFDFIEQYLALDATDFLCTDVSKDGKLEGPSFELYHRLMAQFPNMHLIASGGVSNIQDVQQLKEMNCYATIVGKAIYEERLTLSELVTV
jgi:phosphoribosylformimino-5-aminoimidazole carboxamide ribotide isomerase